MTKRHTRVRRPASSWTAVLHQALAQLVLHG